VTVNAVCPGYVDTPMTDESVANLAARLGRPEEEARSMLAHMQPTGRLVTVDEVASAMMFCIDNASVNGQGVNVDGGAVQS
jgi:NAD(P)-dependent dehydrogenase (short-subunit alcohol dehydrogenase family)